MFLRRQKGSAYKNIDVKMCSHFTKKQTCPTFAGSEKFQDVSYPNLEDPIFVDKSGIF